MHTTRVRDVMAEPITDAVVEHDPGANGAVAESTEQRLSRIEAALSVLSARQSIGPPPEGYAPASAASSGGTLVPLSYAVQAAGYLPGGEPGRRRRWYDLPVVRELRLVSRLYVDRRYSPSRAAAIGVPALLAFLVLNYLFWRGWLDWTVVSPVCERLVVMAVGIVVYRILAHEVERYSAVLDYLERTGR